MNFIKKVKLSKVKKLSVFIKTYGCQQNVSDSEKIKEIFVNLRYNLTENKENADIIVLNTCAVRENAEFRVFGNIGQLKIFKEKNPNLIIVVCGCMTEQAHIVQKIKTVFPFVDIIFGSNSMASLPNSINKIIKNKSQKFFENIYKNIDHVKSYKKTQDYRDNKTKAFVPIMRGCDNFCSYCIVPYVRGKEISREFNEVYNEVENLIKNNYKDITLLGQNVNSYGKGFKKNINFVYLLREITKIPGEYWIRFMTSHPKDVSYELIDEIAKNEKIEKHIHLPVQSGSNRVLKLMDRKYTKEDYFEKIKYIKSKISDVSLTSDVIVGFPGETYQDFKETFELVKKVGYSSLFTFIYSKRKGTKAADLKDDVSYKEKVKWLSELLELQRQKSLEYCSSFKGKKIRVLIIKNKDSTFNCINSENLKVELIEEDIKNEGFIKAEVVSFKERSILVKKL